MIEDVNGLIKLHEGKRLKPYRCTAGKLTIGYGRNLEDVGISDREAHILLVNDVKLCVNNLKGNLKFWNDLSEVRQAVLIDMCYNLGWGGLSQFKHFLAALEAKDFNMAAVEMLDSKWAKQVGARANRLQYMMIDNKWPVA